jgi:molybdopterin-containing oxidoreductase family iron-sulfur binding subunit
MANCPYTAKSFNWFKDAQPIENEKCFNTDVSVRPKGVVEKCTFCVHRLQIAKEKAKAEHREMQDGDYIPACAEVCAAHAIYFGDLDDPQSQASKVMHDYRKFTLQEELGTKPKVHYLSAKAG